MHDDRVVGCRSEEFGGPRPDRGVGDGFQIAQSSPVPEDDSPQSGSVQNPVVRDHAGTESFADRGEGRHTGLDDFSGDPVGVDDDSAQTGQPCRDTGLPDPIPPVNPTRSMAARYRCPPRHPGEVIAGRGLGSSL